MSTYWGFKCKMHENATVTSVKSSYKPELIKLLEYWPHINRILHREAGWDYLEFEVIFTPCRVCGEDSSELWDFLEKHFDCGLLLYNEYGYIEEIKY